MYGTPVEKHCSTRRRKCQTNSNLLLSVSKYLGQWFSNFFGWRHMFHTIIFDDTFLSQIPWTSCLSDKFACYFLKMISQNNSATHWRKLVTHKWVAKPCLRNTDLGKVVGGTLWIKRTIILTQLPGYITKKLVQNLKTFYSKKCMAQWLRNTALQEAQYVNAKQTQIFFFCVNKYLGEV